MCLESQLDEGAHDVQVCAITNQMRVCAVIGKWREPDRSVTVPLPPGRCVPCCNSSTRGEGGHRPGTGWRLREPPGRIRKPWQIRSIGGGAMADLPP